MVVPLPKGFGIETGALLLFEACCVGWAGLLLAQLVVLGLANTHGAVCSLGHLEPLPQAVPLPGHHASPAGSRAGGPGAPLSPPRGNFFIPGAISTCCLTTVLSAEGGGGAQEEEEKEEEEEGEGRDEEGEEYDEEEHEEETDYIMSYFDNGEDFGADSDDNGDEAVY